MNRWQYKNYKISALLFIIVINSCKAHIFNPSIVHEKPDNGNRNKEEENHTNVSEVFNIKQKSSTNLPPSLQIRYNPQKEEFMKNKTKSKMEGYIFGGEYADILTHPHVTFLSANCDNEIWICGSSIINQEMLITAAHCVYGCVDDFRILAFAGSDDLEKVNVMKKVRKYIIHEQYDEDTLRADIGVIQLVDRLPLGESIARVMIQPTFDIGFDGTVAGWGVINKMNTDTLQLKEVKQVIQPKSVCHHIHMEAGMMCVFSGEMANHPAVGDSGSGLIIKNYQLVGVVSFSTHSEPSLVIYTNVSHFYLWIKKHTIKLFCTKK